jgi:hypothetical protein
MNRLIILFFPLSLMAETSGNLLSQDFTNGWTGTNQSSRHGTSTIAGVDGGNVESTISLSDTLNASQINGGWTSTLGADIWSWNNNDQTTTMSQIITGADGTVTTQVRNISTTSSDNYTTYTDSYTQGINSQSDYDITARFSFNESSNSTSHQATDLKNPILTIEYSLLNTSQVAQLKNMSETVYNVVEDIEIVEYISEEFNFETFYEPTIEFTMLEEINFEPIAVEEINTGIIDVFMETITYDEPENIESFSTEIKVTQEIFEVEREDITFEQEVFQERQTDFQTSDASGIIESEPIREETIRGESEEVNGVENTRTGDGNSPRKDEERVTGKSNGQSENQSVSRNLESEESRETNKNTTVSESNESSEGSVTPQDRDSENQGNENITNNETRSVSRVVNEPVQIDIESIKKDIANRIQDVDKQLVATSMIIASIMAKSSSLDSYLNINQDIFLNQQTIDGGNLNEYTKRSYRDDRSIYSEIQIQTNLSLFQYQTKVQETVDERIRAEEHLRSIRGY